METRVAIAIAGFSFGYVGRDRRRFDSLLTPYELTTQLSDWKEFVGLLDGSPLGTAHRLAVDVERHSRAFMPEHFSHDYRAYTLFQEQRVDGMPQFVENDATDSRNLKQRVQYALREVSVACSCREQALR